jgi:hypothetical protein
MGGISEELVGIGWAFGIWMGNFDLGGSFVLFEKFKMRDVRFDADTAVNI